MRLLTLLLFPAAMLAAEPRYARLGEFQGKVEVQLTAADDWTPAVRNLPLLESSWVRTGPSSRVEVELDEGSAWRLGPDSQGAISDYTRLSTGQRITLLALDRGLAYFTGRPEGKDALTLAVPGAQLILTRQARVRLEVEESWSRISVLEGSARFSSPAAEIDLRQGQATRVEPANPARFFLDREVTALELDQWSETRDQALALSPSAGHVIERYGLHDLDSAGEWIQTADLGAVWKPKVDDGWVPFRRGRWLWYGALGYTWVSDEPWGWLPYHHGRWEMRKPLGWVWAPAKTAVFKPGEVYWLRGAKLAGWGPLAPGEDWSWSGPGSDPPRQFLNAWTTYAGFVPDAAVIDPAEFTAPPKEPLRVASFAAALPSPAFRSSRLDAVRPFLNGGRARVAPVLDGVTFVSRSAPPVVVVNPPPATPPVVVVEQPAADPPPPEVVPYPVPVYTGFIVRERSKRDRPAPPPAVPAKSATAAVPPAARNGAPSNPRRDRPAPPPAVPAKSATAAVPPAARNGAPSNPRPDQPRMLANTRDKKFRDAREQRMANQAVAEVDAGSFAKAITTLDAWSQRYPASDFQDDRLYYYLIAFDGVRQPGKVVDSARPLLASRSGPAFQDPRQMILACYLTSVNLQKLPRVTVTQHDTGMAAARGLLQSVAAYFKPENRPAETGDGDWAKTRNELETTARNTLAWLRTHRGLPD